MASARAGRQLLYVRINNTIQVLTDHVPNVPLQQTPTRDTEVRHIHFKSSTVIVQREVRGPRILTRRAHSAKYSHTGPSHNSLHSGQLAGFQRLKHIAKSALL